MPDNPISNQISNPGVSPTEPVPPYGPDKPRLGAGEEAQEPKPFTLGPEGGPSTTEAPTEKPSLMDVAGDAARQQQIAPPELSDQVVKLQKQLSNVKEAIQDPTVNRDFVADHYEAMQRVAQKMDPDLQTMAKYSNGKYTPATQAKGQSITDFLAQWIDGSQGALQGALDYLQTTQKPDPATYLRLQYSVQRAAQRGELFASIVGSSVSGIKTLMSTQLG